MAVSVLDKKPEATHVVMDEIQIENWGFNEKQSLGTKKQSNVLSQHYRNREFNQ